MAASLAIHALVMFQVRNELSAPAPAAGVAETGLELVFSSPKVARRASAVPSLIAVEQALPVSDALPREAGQAGEAAGIAPDPFVTEDRETKDNDSGTVAENETASSFQNEADRQADVDSTVKDTALRLELVQSRLDAHKFYPASARRRGIEGEVELSFALNGKGLADNVLILAGSGYSVLDRAAMQTVQRAQPFPIFDGEYRVRLHFRRL